VTLQWPKCFGYGWLAEKALEVLAVRSDPTVTVSCDGLVEYDDDAAPFAQCEPEFLNGREPARPAPEL
jgi:hypothetical protein